MTTGIEWTDETWNPIVGCGVVSPGCTNCYAMKMAARLQKMNVTGGSNSRYVNHYDGTTKQTKAGAVWTGKVALAPEKTLEAPLGWRRARRIFVNSMGDLFHENVPDEWIDRVFRVMAISRNHTFQVLTKRSRRMRAYFEGDARKRISYGNGGKWPFPNVQLGVSAEDQDRADERIPDLLATPAAVRFVSMEPLLGPVDLLLRSVEGGDWDVLRGREYYSGASVYADSANSLRRTWPKLDWVIVGGESGEGARSMHRKWARDIRDQCDRANVPFFFKQWGEWIDTDEWIAGLKANGAMAVSGVDLRYDLRPLTFGQAAQIAENAGWECAHGSDGSTAIRVGKRRSGRRLDGVEHNAFPRDAA